MGIVCPCMDHMFRPHCTTSHKQHGANGDSCNQYKAMSTASDASPQNIARAKTKHQTRPRENTNTCSSPSTHTVQTFRSMVLWRIIAAHRNRPRSDIRTKERRWVLHRRLALDRVRSSAHRMAVSPSNVGSTYLEHCTKHFEDPTQASAASLRQSSAILADKQDSASRGSLSTEGIEAQSNGTHACRTHVSIETQRRTHSNNVT